MDLHEKALAEVVSNMEPEEQKAVAKSIATEIMFEELRRRYDVMSNIINTTAGAFQKGAAE